MSPALQVDFYSLSHREAQTLLALLDAFDALFASLGKMKLVLLSWP